MVKQYVGARYVPKFYENSLNPLSNEWEENVNYEALTVVTYLSDSYTSKKPVPVTVGNPRDNAEYWSLTGAYNAQVEQYREETQAASQKADAVDLKVGDLDDLDTTNKTSIVNAINEVNNKATPQKRVVVLADSMGVEVGGVTPYTVKLGNLLNLGLNNYYQFSITSIGYKHKYNGTNAKEFLETQISNVINPDTITDFVTSIGLNDILEDSIDDIDIYIEGFIDYVKSVFPNAKIHIGFFGVSTSYSTWAYYNKYIKLLERQKACANKKNILYIKNCEYIMHNRLLAQTNDHPNDNGSTYIARALCNYLTTGNEINVTFQNVSTWTNLSNVDTTCFEYIENGIAWMSPASFTGTVDASGGFVVNGHFSNSMFNGGDKGIYIRNIKDNNEYYAIILSKGDIKLHTPTLASCQFEVCKFPTLYI